ncbi:sugar transferase [Gracilibacillus timonensis]|uniref:sugar transferase n=1 Tax=Gracilibacillus timonensis TaxID=1816696 RepID=UPI000824019A|nr:sugar transferase [Gracilibacillus timonensis]
MYNKIFKRIFDIIASAILIVILVPFMLIISLLVRINLGSPFIFTQERVGLNGAIFKLYKFRSMTNAVDNKGNLLPNNKRLTKFGKVLRSTSMDELPELINILKGNMSFIGPRPLLVEYLPRYNDEQKKRHNVRPGLTSLTAVNGRASLSWDEKLKMDVWYVKNINFLLDIKILLKTVVTVFKRENINSNRGKFMGNDSEDKKEKSI